MKDYIYIIIAIVVYIIVCVNIPAVFYYTIVLFVLYGILSLIYKYKNRK